MTFHYDHLAFSTAAETDSNESNGDHGTDSSTEPLITSVARAPFPTEDGTSCNVELFGSGWGMENESSEGSTKNILLFVPGVCESAETWTVQNLARICSSEGSMLAVLELPGHGLSDGHRAVLQPSGRVGLGKLVDIVVQFARHVVDIMSTRGEGSNVNLALSGCSLGGVLAAYAGPKIAQGIHASRLRNEDEGAEKNDSLKPYSGLQSLQFVGNILLSPAVGVAEQALPPPMIVSALSCLAWVAPSAAIMTPEEDPSHYNCPPTTNRNFSGQWPLGTSKLLLDITADIVPQDIQRCMKNGDHETPFSCRLCAFGSVVIMGQKDHIVPTDKVLAFVEALNKSSEDSDTPVATLVEIPMGDHGLLVPSGKSKSKIVEDCSQHIKEALRRFALNGAART